MTLLERLRKVEPEGGDENRTRWYRNPDGPEAANEIEWLQARVRELEAALREVVEHAEDMNSYDAGRVARATLAAVSAKGG